MKNEQGFSAVAIIIILAILAAGGHWLLQADELKIISPNGGESWVMDTVQTITWVPNKDTSVSLSLVSYSANVECQNQGGEICPQDMSRVISIAERVLNTGNFNWKVNQDGRFWLNICSNQGVCDRSDGTFDIRK